MSVSISKSRPRSSLWFYGAEDSRKGPFSSAEIQGLIRSSVILPSTRLYKQAEAKDYAAIKTLFGVYFSLEAGEKEEAKTVNIIYACLAAIKEALLFFIPSQAREREGTRALGNTYMWLAAISPTVAAVPFYFFYLRGVAYPGSMFEAIAYCVSVAMAFILVDAVALLKAEYRLPQSVIFIGVFWMFPFYIFYRNRLLRQSQKTAFLSLLCCLLTVGMYITWPFYTNKDVAFTGKNVINQLLLVVQPEMMVTCKEASVVSREPGPVLRLKFRVEGKLSDGQTMMVDLIQSKRYLGVPPLVSFTMPKNIGELFGKK